MVNDEPTVTQLILDKLNTTETNLNRRLDATELNLNRRLDEQDKHLSEIKEQTTKTNGRVTVLEKARERAQGVIFAYSWIPSTLSAVLGAGLTILVMALSGNLR